MNTLTDWFDGGPVPLTALEFLRTNVVDGAADNAPLRGGKQSVYEGGIRVPALMYWPGTLAPGVTEDAVAVVDVLPTLLSYQVDALIIAATTLSADMAADCA